MTIPETTRRLAAALALALPLSAGASVSIDVVVSQVSGTTWHYDYVVSGATFNAPLDAGPHGFTLFFDPALYGTLSNESTLNSTWDLFVDQPNAGLFLDGLFDALAVSTPAGTDQPFGIDFEWLGTGTPTGIQAFDYYTCADINCSNLSDLQSGTTTLGGTPPSPMPLPGPLALIAAGLIGLGLQQARRRQA
jgi:hypothetical protein